MLPSGDTYNGQVKNGDEFTGFGKIEYFDNTSFSGAVKNGVKEGIGNYLQKNSI